MTASPDWFENTDVAVDPTRNADGTIDMHGLLVLTSDAPADTGARIVTDKSASSEYPATINVDISKVNTTPQPEADTVDGISPIIPIAAIAVVVLVLAVVIWKKIRG